MKEPVQKFTHAFSKRIKQKALELGVLDDKIPQEEQLIRGEAMNEFIIGEIFGLTKDEMDEMQEREFQAYLEKLNEIRNPLTQTVSSNDSE